MVTGHAPERLGNVADDPPRDARWLGWQINTVDGNQNAATSIGDIRVARV
jgi:hypothetical protein